MNKNHARATETSIRRLNSTLTSDLALSAKFNINELKSALKSIKPGLAAGFDDVYPEFIRNCGERTKEWMILFRMSYRHQPDCQNCSKCSKTRQRWL
jgi:hypothetical protein